MKQLSEAVVVEAVRTPTGRSGWKGMEKKGAFCDVSAQHLIAAALEGLMERVKARCPRFDPLEVEDVAVGCNSQIGEQGLNIGRMAVIAAGLPDEVSGWAINRYCNAGLQAINSQAQAIMTGCGDIMIAAGVEHMSHYPMLSDLDAALKSGYPASFHRNVAKRGLVLMGVAAEMIGEKYKQPREDMDRFSLWSQQKAVKAIRDEEWYKKRIVPVKVGKKDETPVMVDKDEPPRAVAMDDPEAAYERMRQLEPRFKEGGQVTAANSSGIVDGAAATMLMSREKAEELGLEPMVTIRSMAVAGDDPMIMLLAPVPAMKKALARAGLTMDDIEVWEPNEAFASPVLAFCKEFGVAYDDPRINPTGGAIAIGHPIGCTGVLYFTEMVHWMVRHNLRYGLQTLCGGGGVGIATVVERKS
ncbi:MAG: thiolase family protein [Dehalococcoidia bacterium]|jgi:acetyl-CoA acyltransferase|nr:thiolase family protein [Chloroflexota bacterium]MCK4242628.1 thiolase family protein [Dehalococcoidia bacterium]